MTVDEPSQLAPHVPGADVDARLPPLERRIFDVGVYVLLPFAALAFAASLALSYVAVDAIPTLVDQRELLTDLDRGEFVAPTLAADNDARMDDLRTRSIGVFAAFVAAFAIWLALAARNTRHTRQGAVKGTGPGAALVSWFVPLANLVWPRQIVLRVHDASTRSTTSTVEVWWWFFVLGTLANVAATAWGPGVLETERQRQALNLNIAHLAGVGLVAIAGIAAALVVTQISLGQVRTRARQRERLEFERRRDATIRDAVAAADPFGPDPLGSGAFRSPAGGTQVTEQ